MKMSRDWAGIAVCVREQMSIAERRILDSSHGHPGMF